MKIRAVASVLVSSGKPIRAAAEMVTVVAAASYVSIAAAVVPANIRAEIFIPQIVPAYSEAIVSDRINRIAVGKGVMDVVVANEQVSIDFVMGTKADAVTVGDNVSLAPGKGLTDSATATDSVSNIAVGKNAGTDTVTMGDTLASAWVAQRAVTDTVSTADSVSSLLQYSGAVNERIVNVAVVNGENTV